MPDKSVAIGGRTVDIHYAAGGRGAFELWPSMGEYPIYDGLLYSEMTMDEVRNQEYYKAVEALAADKIVLDLGIGADLVWTMAALRAGARKVYAIEEIDNVYELARARIAELRLESRVHLMRGNSMHVTLPERAEVCISEIIGNIGSSEGVVASLLDARRRLLTADAAMVPQRCLTEIAAFALPDDVAGAPSFTDRALPYVERLLQRFGKPVDLRLGCRNVPAASLLSDSAVFEDLDFRNDAPLAGSRQFTLTVQSAGRCDGFLLWIRLFCAEDSVAVDSLRSPTNWRPIFFPIFYPGHAVEAGDTITATVETTLSPDGVHPNYHLYGTLVRRSGEVWFDYASLHNAEAQANNLPIYRKLFASTGNA